MITALVTYLVGIPVFIFLVALFDETADSDFECLMTCALLWPLCAPIVFPVAIGSYLRKRFGK